MNSLKIRIAPPATSIAEYATSSSDGEAIGFLPPDVLAGVRNCPDSPSAKRRATSDVVSQQRLAMTMDETLGTFPEGALIIECNECQRISRFTGDDGVWTTNCSRAT